MSRISTKFKQLDEENKVALVTFVTAGDPTRDFTVNLMHNMVASGADIIELGVPFSDPMAEGPTIQRACERALKNNISIHDVIDMVREFREEDQDTPVILMGYLNPIEVMGYQEFADAAAAAGVDGVITVDMPPEEADPMLDALKPHDIDPILLLSPTSTLERIQSVNEVASGFIYYVSMKGITGGSNIILSEVGAKVAEIRRNTNLPIGIGFGIKDPDTAQMMAQVGDAVIVGSAIVNIIESLAETPDMIAPEIALLLEGMRTALDAI